MKDKIKEDAVKWMQINQCIMKDLINEFHQLRYDDYNFHEQYNEDEFIEWIIDYELNK